MSLEEKVMGICLKGLSIKDAASLAGVSEKKYTSIRDKKLSELGLSERGYRSLHRKSKEIADKVETANYISELEDKIVEFSEDLNKGTGTLKGHLTSEPLTAEEIIKRLKIDQNLWRLSTYYNKEHQDKSGSRYWVITAMVTRLTPKEDGLLTIKKVLEDYKFEYTPAPIKPITNKNFSEKVCAVLSLQDIHIGKLNMEKDFDVIPSVKSCVETLISRAYHSSNLDKIILVLGGDLVNMDTFLGYTSSQKTLVDNSMSAYDAFKLAFDLMFWTVNYTKQFCNELEVVYIPGNHSRLTEAHIAYSLSQCIKSKGIVWNIEYAERKVVTYGNSMICLEHGDYDTKKSPLTFATEYPMEWGHSKFRTLYTGHYHKEKKIEYLTADETNGFTLKILPSLTKSDAYHYSNKWTGNKRGGIIELHHETKGSIAEFKDYQN